MVVHAVPPQGEVGDAVAVDQQFPVPVAACLRRVFAGCGNFQFTFEPGEPLVPVAAGDGGDVDLPLCIRFCLPEGAFGILLRIENNRPDLRHRDRRQFRRSGEAVEVVGAESLQRSFHALVGKAGVGVGKEFGKSGIAQLSPVDHLACRIFDDTGRGVVGKCERKEILSLRLPRCGFVHLLLRRKFRDSGITEEDRWFARRVEVERQQDGRNVHRVASPAGELPVEDHHADPADAFTLFV